MANRGIFFVFFNFYAFGRIAVFFLTKNEVGFAQTHKEKYELWFVFIKNGIAGEPFELGNIFVFENGEDFFQNHRFSVEQNDFKLRAKII